MQLTHSRKEPSQLAPKYPGTKQMICGMIESLIRHLLSQDGMRRSLLLVPLLLVCLPQVVAALDQGDKPTPNVLFIAVDDWNDWVGCLGHKQAITPNVDRLASQGLLFTNAHCAAPVCNPSRVAVLTGLRPGTTGVFENGAVMRKKVPDVVTLPQQRIERTNRYANAVRKLSKESDIPLVDIWKAFEQYGAAPGKSIDDLLLDQMHPNDQGHLLVAKLLCKTIAGLPVDGREIEDATDRKRRFSPN